MKLMLFGEAWQIKIPKIGRHPILKLKYSVAHRKSFATQRHWFWNNYPPKRPIKPATKNTPKFLPVDYPSVDPPTS